MKKGKASSVLKRYIVFAFGLFLLSLGAAFITKAKLGTSPITSIPYVLSENFPLTVGNFTIIICLIFLGLQVILLRKRFKLSYLLQLPVSFGFGYFMDFSMMLCSRIAPANYFQSIVFLLLGCIILAFGVYFEVMPDVAMLPAEGLCRVIARMTHKEFGIIKIIFDLSMVATAVILAFCLEGKLSGVREGTLVAAFLTGYIVKFLSKLLHRIPEKLFKVPQVAVD